MSEPLVAHERIMFSSLLIVTHVIKLQLKEKAIHYYYNYKLIYDFTHNYFNIHVIIIIYSF